MSTYKLLNKEEILQQADKELVKGISILSSYAPQTAKNGKEYYNGTLKAQGNLEFKVWGGQLFDQLKAEDYQGVPVYIEAEVNVWNDTKSLILKKVVAVDAVDLGIDITPLDPTKYDIAANEKEFYTLLKEELSPNGFELFKRIYNRIRKEFRSEYAAVKIHDAYRGGLLAHTLKMLKVLRFIWNTYPNIRENMNKDLVFIGLSVHDMGKILEYNNGTRTEIAFATHNFLGQEILFEFKKDIVEGFEAPVKGSEETLSVEPFGNDFYYRLQAIIQQHHGEFGEPCHTIESYLVHLVDMFESRLEIFEESLPFTGSISIDFGKYRLE
jgi:CMP-binding factor